jgi:opacity protein-like surface antigen
MKNVLLIAAAAAALVGCQKAATKSDQPAAPEASNSAASAPAGTVAAMTTANGSTPGTFEVITKDGKKGHTVLNADGTYVDTDPSGKATKGTWNVTGGKTCFDPEGKEGPSCYAETAVGADGSFTATSDKGEKVTVKKIS